MSLIKKIKHGGYYVSHLFGVSFLSFRYIFRFFYHFLLTFHGLHASLPARLLPLSYLIYHLLSSLCHFLSLNSYLLHFHHLITFSYFPLPFPFPSSFPSAAQPQSESVYLFVSPCFIHAIQHLNSQPAWWWLCTIASYINHLSCVVIITNCHLSNNGCTIIRTMGNYVCLFALLPLPLPVPCLMP